MLRNKLEDNEKESNYKAIYQIEHKVEENTKIWNDAKFEKSMFVYFEAEKLRKHFHSEKIDNILRCL